MSRFTGFRTKGRILRLLLLHMETRGVLRGSSKCRWRKWSFSCWEKQKFLVCQKQTIGIAVIGPLLCCLTVIGQFQLSKMAAYISETQVGWVFLLSCDITAGDSFRIVVHAGKIGQHSEFTQHAPSSSGYTAYTTLSLWPGKLICLFYSKTSL